MDKRNLVIRLISGQGVQQHRPQEEGSWRHVGKMAEDQQLARHHLYGKGCYLWGQVDFFQMYRAPNCTYSVLSSNYSLSSSRDIIPPGHFEHALPWE